MLYIALHIVLHNHSITLKRSTVLYFHKVGGLTKTLRKKTLDSRQRYAAFVFYGIDGRDGNDSHVNHLQAFLQKLLLLNCYFAPCTTPNFCMFYLLTQNVQMASSAPPPFQTITRNSTTHFWPTVERTVTRPSSVGLSRQQPAGRPATVVSEDWQTMRWMALF